MASWRSVAGSTELGSEVLVVDAGEVVLVAASTVSVVSGADSSVEDEHAATMMRNGSTAASHRDRRFVCSTRCRIAGNVSRAALAVSAPLSGFEHAVDDLNGTIAELEHPVVVGNDDGGDTA